MSTKTLRVSWKVRIFFFSSVPSMTQKLGSDLIQCAPLALRVRCICILLHFTSFLGYTYTHSGTQSFQGPCPCIVKRALIWVKGCQVNPARACSLIPELPVELRRLRLWIRGRLTAAPSHQDDWCQRVSWSLLLLLSISSWKVPVFEQGYSHRRGFRSE